MMKKGTRKLALCSETIRALTHMDLALVAAGANDRVVGTQDAGTGCPLQVAAAAEPAK
jgi:hypothetical protein